MENIKKYVAEGIGTFALVFCGAGSIIVNQETGGVVTQVGIAITFGLIVMVMIYALGEISGAHLNPAVTIGFWLAGEFSKREIIFYFFAQVIGAIGASMALHLLFPENQTLGASLPSGTALQSFVFEFILTFILMFVILFTSKGNNTQKMFAGVAVGSVVLLEALFAGPVCGASMNPARSIGPALISGHLEHLWIYLSAPFAGAALSAAVWKWLKN